MIKAGTLCRTLVWPILPPLILYKWIRDTDRDMYLKANSTIRLNDAILTDECIEFERKPIDFIECSQIILQTF